MAFRPTMGQWMALLRGGSRAAYSTSSTVPKMKAHAPSADYGYIHNQQHHGKQIKTATAKGDFVPVYVAIGDDSPIDRARSAHSMAAAEEFANCACEEAEEETLPEVVEPEHVAEESEHFLKSSFFRKVAHVQGRSYPDKELIPDSIRKDAYAYKPRIETLKSVGIDPAHA